MIEELPKATIIIPAFNVSKYIDETLTSAISQSFINFEIIVIDDRSTDSTKSIAENYAHKDKRITVITNTGKKGVSGARNTGIKHAKGEWIAFLDSDDLLHPESLHARLEVAALNPDAEFITGDFARFDTRNASNENRQSLINRDWNDAFGWGTVKNETVEIVQPVVSFLKSVLVCTDTVLIKTEILKALQGFDEDLTSAEDVHLWLRVAASVDRLFFTPKSMAYYRQREGSLTRSGFAIHHNAPKAYKKLLKDPLFTNHKAKLKENIINFTHNNTYHYRKSKNYTMALKSAAEGLRLDPVSTVSWRNFAASMCLR